jgi:hypothetical protein
MSAEFVLQFALVLFPVRLAVSVPADMVHSSEESKR